MIRAARPSTLQQAIEFLRMEPALVPVAGCTDLMVNDPLSLHAVEGVVDVTGIEELQGIDWRGDNLAIGAAVPFSDIGSSATVCEHFPILAEAAAMVGGWQIQNRATLGGNIANASPAGDSLPALLVLDASIVVAGEAGERQLPYTRFHTGYRETALLPGELIVRIELPRPAAGSHQAYRKVGTREAQAISKVVVAGWARLEGREFAEVRLAAGSVAPTPIRLAAVEQALLGVLANKAAADLAGRLASQSIEPIDDVRSTASYRRWVLGRVVRRMTLNLMTPRRDERFG